MYYIEDNSHQIDIKIQCEPNQKSNRCFCFALLKIDELILEFIWKCKGPRLTSHVKEERQGENSFSIKYKDLPQIYSNQDAVVLIAGETNGPLGKETVQTVMNRHRIVTGGTGERTYKVVL